MDARRTHPVLLTHARLAKIELEKIGTTNFYWSFPSKAIVSLRQRVESLQGQLDETEAACAAMRARIDELSAGREDGVRT